MAQLDGNEEAGMPAMEWDEDPWITEPLPAEEEKEPKKTRKQKAAGFTSIG